MYELRLKFHWSLFLRFQLTIFQHWFRKWLGSDQAPSHYLNQWWIVYWRIYASLDLKWGNSLDPGRCGSSFKSAISKCPLHINFMSNYCVIDLRWIQQNTFDDKSILVQVMAWCHQATSHYLSQYWPRSSSPYGITRPQWVNSLRPIDTIWCHSWWSSSLYHQGINIHHIALVRHMGLCLPWGRISNTCAIWAQRNDM